jgi:hypothetical protein
MYGHVLRLAEAVAEGVQEVAGCEVTIKRVPETLPKEVLGNKKSCLKNVTTFLTTIARQGRNTTKALFSTMKVTLF